MALSKPAHPEERVCAATLYESPISQPTVVLHWLRFPDTSSRFGNPVFFQLQLQQLQDLKVICEPGSPPGKRRPLMASRYLFFGRTWVPHRLGLHQASTSERHRCIYGPPKGCIVSLASTNAMPLRTHSFFDPEPCCDPSSGETPELRKGRGCPNTSLRSTSLQGLPNSLALTIEVKLSPGRRKSAETLAAQTSIVQPVILFGPSGRHRAGAKEDNRLKRHDDSNVLVGGSAAVGRKVVLPACWAAGRILLVRTPLHHSSKFFMSERSPTEYCAQSIRRILILPSALTHLCCEHSGSDWFSTLATGWIVLRDGRTPQSQRCRVDRYAFWALTEPIGRQRFGMSLDSPS
ncbi:uncharacterized protein CLUP02_00982 [Colletotrichum lupini]|uniref:Uncharacterized protein n=1 Tax=Colletotrichum lupini TaxID=145971 RepID=A0A9Q8W8R0_9PEZI|nr:uncharacterized protein CLUP02_00982 [Colletotrichum lupini]UQC74334.1 hypothetical protein CLUP02_00982 [Colletotrichum lupini]